MQIIAPVAIAFKNEFPSYRAVAALHFTCFADGSLLKFI